MKTTFFGMSDNNLPSNRELEQLINLLPGTSTSRRIVRLATARWGVMLVDPFREFANTLTMSRNRNYSSGMTLDNIVGTGDSGSRAPYLYPPTLRGRWGALPADVPEALGDVVQSYASRWRAPRTLKRRYSSWMKIIRLCMKHDMRPLPMTAGTAVSIMSLEAERGASYSELRAVRDCIRFVHKYQNVKDPTHDTTFQRVWAGIQRTVGTGNPKRKIALTRDEVGKMIDLARKANREDHAVAMAIAFEGATRVSELCALQVEDIVANGRHVHIASSKTDQFGRGADVVLEHRYGAPFDANLMVLAWLRKLGRKSGPLLSPMRDGYDTRQPLLGRTFTRFVKCYGAQIGIPPRSIGSHSFRAGWITEELSIGRKEAEVATHVRHSSLSSLLRYYRPRTIPPNLVQHAEDGEAA